MIMAGTYILQLSPTCVVPTHVAVMRQQLGYYKSF